MLTISFIENRVKTYFPFCMCNNITILEAVKQLNENAMKKFLFITLLLASGLTYALAQQSGSCGDNLTWTLDEDGTLTISGTGEMYDYTIYNENIGGYGGPWGRKITQLILEDGITYIGRHAFYQHKGLIGTLMFPASLTGIGASAFEDCRELTGKLILPAGLTTIGQSAFQYCSGFTGSLILPEGLTTIGKHAFSSCSGFTDTLMLPESLPDIGLFAFANCKFSVVLNENRIPIVIDSDVFFSVTLSKTKLCVPVGSGTAYSQAEVWKDFNIEEYGVGIRPSFSENGGTVDCGTEISIATKPEAELYYGLGKDAAPTLRYTGSIAVTDTTYISAYSRVRNVYSDTVRATYIPEHAASFIGMDWDWSAEHKATLSLTCPRCETKIKPAVSLSEELTKEATEEEAGLKTYTATATANEVTYKSINREVLPRLIQPIHDTVVKTDTIVVTEVKTDTVTVTEVKIDTITVTITDTVYIEVETGNGAAETMQVKLYPNPTNGSFTVEAEEDAYLQIYNAAGACIQSKRMQGGRFTGTLPSSGLYFIKLTARNRTYTKRLIVQ